MQSRCDYTGLDLTCSARVSDPAGMSDRRSPSSLACQSQPVIMPARQIGLRADRVRVLLYLQDYDAAVVEALTAAEQSELPAGGAYRLACVLSLVSAELADAAEAERGDPRDQVERLQSRAVELLKQSREMGYFENPDAIEHFESATDLDALRHREDFEKLRSRLRIGTQKSA